MNRPTPRVDDAIASAMQSIARADARTKAEAALQGLTVAYMEAMCLPGLIPLFEKAAGDPALAAETAIAIHEMARDLALAALPALVNALNRQHPGWDAADVKDVRIENGGLVVRTAAAVTPELHVHVPENLIAVNVAPPQLNLMPGAIQAHTHLPADRDLTIEYDAAGRPVHLRRS